MRRIGFLILALAPLACVPATTSPMGGQPSPSAAPSAVTPAASPSLQASPTGYVQTVTGLWAVGAANEPPAGATESCGDEVRLLEDEDGLSLVSNSGNDMAAGRREGARLVLAPVSEALAARVGRKPAAFDLTFDPVSGHYHGTRNGEPCWLAPVSKSCRIDSLQQPTLQGEVRDVDGRLVPAGKIRAVSVEPSDPFEATTDIVAGKYRLSFLKGGVKFEFTVTADGYRPLTRRQRLLAPPGTSTLAILNFGGPATDDDPDAPAFPLVPASSPTPGS